jgi:hypothetical protein
MRQMAQHFPVLYLRLFQHHGNGIDGGSGHPCRLDTINPCADIALG